jgi:hypothetical protein
MSHHLDTPLAGFAARGAAAIALREPTPGPHKKCSTGGPPT